jgi:transglutaminase-like putative cysteine protease
VAWVRQRVRYDRSTTTGARHAVLAAAGTPLFDRLVEVGAGDCDLQNALLAAMFDRAGVASRLAVGALGVDGRTVAGLHAWVEIRNADGTWRVVDASTPRPASPAIARHRRPSEAGPVALEETDRPAAVRSVRWWVGAVVVAALAICTAAWWTLQRRTRRRAGTPSELDPATVVRAALERPQAWGPRAALDRRPLVATFGGGCLSVARARVLACRRELVAAVDRDRWSELIGTDGPVTVDLADPAGQELAAALHLPVVDDWARTVDRARPTAAAASIERALHSEGVRWNVRSVVEAPEPAVAARGWRALAAEGRRVVLVRSPADGADTPARQLVLGRVVCDAIGLPDSVSRRVMRRVASELLRRGDG